MTNYHTELQEIIAFVGEYRQKYDVTPDRERKSELSGEGFGEFEMLLYRQLIPTETGYGAWQCLEDKAMREGVLQVIRDYKNPPQA